MKNYILCLVFLLLLACEQDNQVQVQAQAQAQKNTLEQSSQAAKQIGWDDLIPAEYLPDAIILKYKSQIDTLEDDTSQARDIYQKIVEEMSNAPINQKIADKLIKLDGFIAPLTQNNGKISEFLLVPYFGACIHVPPPPVNQTILVKTAVDYKKYSEI